MALSLLLLALGVTSRTLATYVPDTPVTVPLTTMPFGTEDQSNDAPGLGRTAAPNGVDQLKLSIGGDREIYVTWQTGTASITDAAAGKPAPPDTASYPAVVSYGLHPDPTGHYESKSTDCEKTYYIQDYSKPTVATFGSPATYYVSQIIVHCKLSNLLPSTTYYYRAGAPGGYSVEYSFKTPPATGPNFPVKLGVIADVGNTLNSTATLQHLTANTPDFFTIIGDLVYADRYTSQGVVNILDGVSNGVPNNQTDQLNWDAFGRQLQTFANSASTPINVVAGNHEIERDDSGATFQSVQARFKSPYVQSKSTNPLYYSFNYGGVHMIMLHAYDGPIPNNVAGGPNSFPTGNYPQTSLSQQQFTWLQADLAAVDRSVTPWVVAQIHPPWYNSYVAHYKEVECLQQQLEDVLYNAGVDLALFGHVHAYERTNRVYKYQVNPCGTVHVTVGDGGNIEWGIRQFADVCGGGAQGPNPKPAVCYDNGIPTNTPPIAPALKTVSLPTAARYCATYQNYPGIQGYYPNPNVTAGGFYVPNAQPPWSAYRDPSFGHAIVEFKSATEATISWFKNQLSVATPSDTTTITRDPTCFNQKGGFANKPPANKPLIGQAAAVINGIVDGSTLNNIVNHQTGK